MSGPWRYRNRQENNIKTTRAVAGGGGDGDDGVGLAKRDSGAMSHHTVLHASANKVQVQAQHENSLDRDSCSYSYTSPRAPPQRFFHPIRHLRVLLSLAVLLATWSSLLGAVTATATAAELDSNVIDARSALSVPVADQDLAWKGPSLLVLDTSPPPEPPLMHLYRRQDDATTTSSPSSKTTLKTDPSASKTPFTVPVPFDTALSNNFTASCATFFRRLLTDPAFQECHPFSLMLQTSSSFFDASKSYIRITQTLEATCKANKTTCTETMAGLARELVEDNNCAVDYSNDNPQVLQAHNGLIAYEPLYQASCLRDDEGSYCYANAVTNTSATTDSYPYHLPLGVALPGGTRPTCNSCLQDAMAIFSAFADNATQPISKTYNSAAQQIQVACGPTFVNKTATPLKGAASATSTSLTPTLALLMIFIFYFL